MSKRYENTRTGAIIEVVSVISGEDWKEIKKPTKKKEKSSEGES